MAVWGFDTATGCHTSGRTGPGRISQGRRRPECRDEYDGCRAGRYAVSGYGDLGRAQGRQAQPPIK